MEKINYLQNLSIEEFSDNILSGLKKNIKIRDISIDLDQVALLVIDMQNYFLDKRSHAYIPSVGNIIHNIQSLIHFFKQNNLPIIFTKHIDKNDSNSLMSRWWKGSINDNSFESDIAKDFDIKKGIIIKKETYDCFYNTGLEQVLLDNSIKQIIVTGIMTHLCVETTIRSAFVRNFITFLPVDGTADYNIDFLKSSLLSLSHGFTTPTSSKILLEKLNGH